MPTAVRAGDPTTGSPYRYKASAYSSHTLLLESLPVPGAGKRLLDIGCASGYLSDLLAQRGFRVTGIESSAHAVENFPASVKLVHADLDNGLPPLPEPLARPAQLGLWLEETRNDLEPAARSLVPAIGTLIERLAARPGCILARMSGSGATVFGLFGSSALAHQAAHDLRAAYPGYWVAAAPLLAAPN